MKDMTGAELMMLIKGIDGKTPLGRIVSIRAETDRDAIRKFSPWEKRVYNKWRQKSAKQVSEKEMTDVIEGFKQVFLNMSGNGEI